MYDRLVRTLVVASIIAASLAIAALIYDVTAPIDRGSGLAIAATFSFGLLTTLTMVSTVLLLKKRPHIIDEWQKEIARYDIKWVQTIPAYSITGYIRNYRWEELVADMEEVKAKYLAIHEHPLRPTHESFFAGWCRLAASPADIRAKLDRFPHEWGMYMSFDSGDVIYARRSKVGL